MTQLGELALWIALLMAAWCATLAIQGALMRRPALVASGARGLYASCMFATLATLGLGIAFLGGDYSLRYVAMHSGSGVETLYKLCALWSAAPGKALIASSMVAGAASAAALAERRRGTDRARAAWTVAALGAIVAASLAAAAFGANPFARLPRAAGDGRGLEPILRNPWMAVQAPLMLLGVACAVAPLAMLFGAVTRRPVEAAYVARLRVSALVSWILLSAGLLAAARWSYTSPGVRSMMRGDVFVVASAALWVVLTLSLVSAEFRAGARARASEADSMRRGAGKFVALTGAVLCLAVLAARPLAKHYDAQIGDGQKYAATDAWGHAWTFTSQGASRLERPGDDVIAVALLPTRDGVRQPFVTSESRQYYAAGGLDIYAPATVPGFRGGIAQDLIVVLSDAGEGTAVLRITFEPLVELVWIGGVLLSLGALLLLWPPRAEFGT